MAATGITFRADDELAARLRALAAFYDVTMTELLRVAATAVRVCYYIR